MVVLPSQGRVLWQFFLLTYLALLANGLGYLRHLHYDGPLTVSFIVMAYLTYCLVYMAPVVGTVMLLDRVLRLDLIGRVWARLWPDGARSMDRFNNTVVFAAAMLGTATLQVLVFADRFIYGIYGFHINGFVWNLVFTRGGLESMGGGTSTTVAFTLIIIGFIFLQVGLLAVVIYGQRLHLLRERLAPRRWVVASIVLLIVAAGFSERVIYGLSSIRNNEPVLAAAEALPFYLPTTFRSLAKRMGMDVRRGDVVRVAVKTEMDALNYPLAPLQVRPDAPRYNIVWLAVESLRADVVDPEVMPRIHGFAQESTWFHQHYSGGNGTRMGMFSMFYGVYGNYWFPFLAEKRGPVLFDMLMAQNYQLEMYTSAAFTYPEFDKTIFAHVAPEHLHELKTGAGWERDRVNVTNMLSFMDRRDRGRPFMTFMFFESPHARYHFPPEFAKHKPYLDEFNYATVALDEDMPLIKNRYLNACGHLDSQVARVIDYLKANGLLETTIIIITGDHGEEFMEAGRWGHGSAFSMQQICPPLIIHAPGRGPEQITRLTSHMDIPVTVLTLLGVTNPPSDYSQGYDLFGKDVRQYTILADWDDLVYVDSEYKAVLPFKGYSMSRQIVTTNADGPVASTSAFYQSRQTRLFDIMHESTEFSRNNAAPDRPAKKLVTQ